jgi:hypothetical protein
MPGEVPIIKQDNRAPEEEQRPHKTPVVCRQKITLLIAYEAVIAQHAAALADLTRKIGTASQIEYVSMYRAAEIMRKDAADLREELEFHVKQHAC